MGIKKIKISKLPLAESLVGLYTIGVDALNKSVKVGLEFVKTAADRADTSATNADKKATAADSAAGAANTAANNANAKAELAENKAAAANSAATLADQKAAEANATIVRLEELEASLVGQYKMVPTGMTLSYTARVTRRNTVPGQIKYELLPTNTGRNVLFLGDDNAVAVQPNGSFMAQKAGISKIHVIPTENTTIYKTIQITVVEPGLRKIKSNSLRLMSNGNFRLT